MAKVKILLENGETVEQAEFSLLKALNSHNNGDIHEGEAFADPAMTDLVQSMESEHAKIYADMLNEINAELEKEYIK